ncbi:DUF1648 domain-containing protein [Paenibacillus septentrionalis]|uniref:DUF1648 domain-containing protein n=1 Tax=Paenibacillus septentrionalis TaxID=429342 RepID=A0ABW1V420_9BACL
MAGIELWILLGIFIPIIVITAITPIMTRKIEAFGVTVPEHVKQEQYIARHIKRYMISCVVLGVVVLIALYALLQKQSAEDVLVWLYPLCIGGYVLLTFVMYYMAHSAIKNWKTQQPWYKEQITVQKIVVQTGFHHKKLTISIAWYIPHLLLVICTMAYSLFRFDDYPEQIPMQYSFDGEVTRVVEKSLSSILMLSVVALSMLIVFLFAHYSIVKSKQVIESNDPEGSAEKNRIFRYAWSVYIAIAGFFVVMLMCIGQLSPLLQLEQSVMMSLVLGIIAIVVIGSIVLSIKLGQGGSRIRLKDRQADAVSVADLDQYWKAGIFYFNRKDPAIFVEKRFGVGWSMNFGNPMSWVIFIGLLAIILLPTLFLS